MSAIELQQLTKTYGDVTAVDRFTLEIEDGEFLALLGPSGCGKSTVLRMLAGLLEPTAGRVMVGDNDITLLPARDRDVAMVFQSYALYPHLDVRANLAFGLTAHNVVKAEVDDRVNEVAGQLGLTELLDRKPRELSGGQRQRVALGRAIARRPAAYLMDEPLSNLDASLRTATRRELIELHRSLGTTIIYVTHDQIEAMTMATKIVVMNAGKIEQVGTPLEVFDKPASTFVAGFIGSPPINLIDAEIRSERGIIRAVGDGVDLELAEGDTPTRKIVFGVRPLQASIVGVGEERPEAVPWAIGGVGLVENLGNEKIAYVDVGSNTVAVRLDRDANVAEGSQVRLAVCRTDVHLFDAETGRRLKWQASAPSKEKANA